MKCILNTHDTQNLYLPVNSIKIRIAYGKTVGTRLIIPGWFYHIVAIAIAVPAPSNYG